VSSVGFLVPSPALLSSVLLDGLRHHRYMKPCSVWLPGCQNMLVLTTMNRQGYMGSGVQVEQSYHTPVVFGDRSEFYRRLTAKRIDVSRDSIVQD
jgi:hypothetical protein